MKDFRSGQFKDAAKGIKPYIGVPKSWNRGTQCTTEGIIAEVKQLCNCPNCAKEQVRVLKTMPGRNTEEADLTERLATELSALLDAQKNGADNESIKQHRNTINATRAQIESVGGWVYGSTPGLRWKEVGSVKPTAAGLKWKKIEFKEVEKLASGLKWKRTEHTEPAASGLKWQSVGTSEPATGQQLFNTSLEEALSRKTELTQEEWNAFGISNLSKDHFVKSGDSYFTPAAAGTTECDAPRSFHPKLSKALMNQTKFTQQEWDAFGITELRMDDIVESGGVRFEPDEMGIEIKNEALAEALQHKTEFSPEEFMAFNLEGLSHSCYIQVITPKAAKSSQLAQEDEILREDESGAPSAAGPGDSLGAEQARYLYFKPVAAGGTQIQNDDLAAALQQKVQFSREELEKFGVADNFSHESYIKVCSQDGSGHTFFKPVDPVEWPADSVEHTYGKYGQPMCDKCKELSLDFSTIWADLIYIRYATASEKDCFNGTRDRNREGMQFEDFMQLKEVQEAGLSEAQLLALRFYTSHSFAAINVALRKAHKPHPLPATVMCVSDGLKDLRGLDAESDDVVEVVDFFRGFSDTRVTEEFMKKGGTQTAPMSTSKDYDIACGYAIRKGEGKGALLMKIVTNNNLQRGADLTFLSMFPGEAETLFPPLTFVQPTGKTEDIQIKTSDGNTFTLTIVEVSATLP